MKKIIFTLLVASSFILTAQEEDKGTFTLSGSVDTYYSSNLSENSLGTVGVLSDVPANGFGLGMVNTVFSYEKGKTGVVADLAYGPRANAANANSNLDISYNSQFLSSITVVAIFGLLFSLSQRLELFFR